MFRGRRESLSPLRKEEGRLSASAYQPACHSPAAQRKEEEEEDGEEACLLSVFSGSLIYHPPSL